MPPDLLKDRLARFPLFGWINQRWGHISTDSQPFYLNASGHQIAEMGNNGGLMDYIETDRLLSLIKGAGALHNADPARPIFLHFGIHLETAADYLPRAIAALNGINALADNGVTIRALALQEDSPGESSPATISGPIKSPRSPRPGRYFYSPYDAFLAAAVM